MPASFSYASQMYLSLVNNSFVTGAGTGAVTTTNPTTGPTLSFSSGSALTVAAFVKLTDKLRSYCILAKNENFYSNGGYVLRYDKDTDKFDWTVNTYMGSFTASIAAPANVTTASSGTLVVASWVGGGCSIGVNGGTFVNASTVTNVTPESRQFVGTAHDSVSSEKRMLTVGYDPGNANATYLNGKVGYVGIWNRLLTTAEITTMYNTGGGTNFAALGATVIGNLAGWWNLNADANDNTLFANGLTNNGSVTFGFTW